MKFYYLSEQWGGDCHWYNLEECDREDAEYVGIADFDAALAREAALREELAKYKGGCVDLSSQVRELEHKMDYWEGSNKALQQRLTAAEQRNESLRGLLRSASTDYACCLESGYDRITQLGGDCDSVSKMLDDNPNYAKYIAALKPTESGASNVQS